MSAVPNISATLAPTNALGTTTPAVSVIAVDCVSTPSAETRAAWVTLAAEMSDATVFHEPGWFDAVQATFGHRIHTLVAKDAGGRVVGILPLVEVRSCIAGTRLISAAYGTSGGLLSRNVAASRALIRETERFASSIRANMVELRSRDCAADGWQSDSRHVEFVRDLPTCKTDAETWLPRKARSAARQAIEREGLTVHHDRADLDLVWNLYSRSMRRLGSINYPRRFFHNLADRFGDRLWVTTVRRGPRTVAGVLSFRDRNAIRPYFAGLDERLRCTGCANLLYRSVMERALEHGLTTFDFGRTRRDNRGAFEFKENQGFTPRPIEYRRFVPGCIPVIDISPSNPRIAAARRLWTHLPLFLTRPLGAWLSRAIPG